MNKFFNFLAQSNRYRHLIGGFFVAMLGGALYPALYATIVAASCLELKDCLYGNFRDWLCTLAGGITTHQTDKDKAFRTNFYIYFSIIL